MASSFKAASGEGTAIKAVAISLGGCDSFNAAAVILAHNHPSGETTPSQADKTLTQRLVQVLQLVDIRVPDHLIVGGRQIYSFAEHGLL